MSTIDLEQLAIDHHAAGGRWDDFWTKHADEIRAAVPCFDRGGFRRLYARLLALVVSGDLDGTRPIGDGEPWLADELASEAKAADVGTRAKLQPGAIGR